MTRPRLTSMPLKLGALPTAPSCAREVSKVQLDSWGLNSLSEVTAIVVSELVTNAVQACTPLQEAGEVTAREVRFRMSVLGSRVRIEVWDPSPELPAKLDGVEPLDDIGRGLQIVDALTDGHWGSAASPDVGGKVVWAEVAGDPEAD